MTLRLKANLIFGVIATLAVVLAALLIGHAGHQARLACARREAAAMTAQASALAQYTSQEVAPLIDPGDRGALFVPQSTSFYAIETVSRMVAQMMPGTTLRRVVLDPSGAVDRPDAWERQALDRVIASADHAPLLLERPTATGSDAVLVTPLRMSNGICATCYVSRAAAPSGVLDAFGQNQGFDRKPGVIVGATMASVPLDGATGSSTGAAILWLLLLAGTLWVAFNVVLDRLVLRPFARLVSVAERISLGHHDVDEFPADGGPELLALSRSFTRMRRSVETAMAQLEP